MRNWFYDFTKGELAVKENLQNKSTKEKIVKKKKLTISQIKINLINELVEKFQEKYSDVDIYETDVKGCVERRTQMQYTNLKHLEYQLSRSIAIFHIYYKNGGRTAFINKKLVEYIEAS